MEVSQCSAESANKEEAVLPVLYEDIRNQDVQLDFAINVGGESFPVHQITLTTHSKYFRAMLAHDTKENQQGFVDMKEVSPEGVRECVEFMYSGKVNVEDVTVEDILQVADMLQLVKVIKKCIEFLNEMLESGNCVSVFNLATKYSFIELQEKAQNFLEKSFDIEITELLQLSNDGFVKFLGTNSLCNEVAWDCINNWIKYDLDVRSELIHDLVKLLDWDQFSSPLLLRRLWAASIFRNCSMCRELVFENLFFDLEVFESNLSVETYFILKTITNQFKYVTKQIKDMLFKFFKKQIILLSTKRDFKLLDSGEILSLFESEKSDILTPETWWWHTAVMWVKHNPDRKNIFSKLIKSIRFDKLSSEFLKYVVKNEQLVKNSDECLQVLFDALIQPRQIKTKASVVVLYSDGRIRALDVMSKTWSDIKQFPKPEINSNIFNFNGKLCLINGTKLFYFQGSEWIEKRSMDSDMTGPKKITTLSDCIYVVFEKRMFRYNSLHDSWAEFVIPACHRRLNDVVALNGFVYLCASTGYCSVNKDLRLEVQNEKWLCRSPYFRECTFAVVDDEIYSCDGYQIIKRWDVNEANNRWVPLEEASNPSIVFDSSLSTLLNLNGRLVRVDYNSKINIYDDICSKWNHLSDIPAFGTVFQGQQTNFKVVSACSFYEDLDIGSPVQKRKKI